MNTKFHWGRSPAEDLYDLNDRLTHMVRALGPPDWFDLSVRLRRMLYFRRHTYFGWYWTEECGHWKMVLVRNSGVYKD